MCCSSMLPDLRAPPLIALVALIVGRREEACAKALLMSYCLNLPGILSAAAFAAALNAYRMWDAYGMQRTASCWSPVVVALTYVNVIKA